jgi:hypothetical protein
MHANQPTADSSVGAVAPVKSIPPRGFQHSILRMLQALFTTPRGWWLICVCVAAIQLWPARNHMFSDGLSYLDIGSEASSGNLAALGNSYWSPAYPALIGSALFLFRPSAAHEVPVVQLVNFVIFILALGAFSLFFRYWSRLIPEVEQGGTNKRLLTLVAFASFLWFTATLVEISLVTPDMLVVAMVFMLAAMGCRTSLPDPAWKHFAGLGTLLGLAIYVKAALFPLAFAFIALLFVSLARSSAISRKRQLAFLALTATMCAVVAAPLIICMSVQAGKLSMGESGKLNYLWVVDQFKPASTGWTGETPPEYGTPLHPPRKLMENPTVLEFATPIAGTYPLWHSPGYWYAGAKTVLNLRKQILAIRASLHEYLEIPVRAIGSDGFIGGAILLFVLSMREKKRAKPVWMPLWLWAWPLVGCAMYSLVWAHWRYVAAYLLLLCLGVYRALLFRVERRVAVGVCTIALLFAMTPLALSVWSALVTTVRQFRHPVDEEYMVVGQNLQHLGLQSGDQLAVVGPIFHPYYARYDRLRVVSQIQDSDAFWGLNQSDAKRVEDRLASIGVKALVAFNRPASNQENGWKEGGALEGRSVSVLLLDAARDPSQR